MWLDWTKFSVFNTFCLFKNSVLKVFVLGIGESDTTWTTCISEWRNLGTRKGWQPEPSVLQFPFWAPPPTRCWWDHRWWALVRLLGTFDFTAQPSRQSCPTLRGPMNRSTPGLPVHHHLPEFTQAHVHRVSDAIQPSHPLSAPSPAPNPSQHQGLFQWVSSSPKYWSFSFNISPSIEHPGLISFRMDWLDLLAVQGTLKSLLQQHSSKASILRRSAYNAFNYRNTVLQ